MNTKIQKLIQKYSQLKISSLIMIKKNLCHSIKIMNNQTIVCCVVALILGMLIANMLKSVCGCKNVVEGQFFYGGCDTGNCWCVNMGIEYEPQCYDRILCEGGGDQPPFSPADMTGPASHCADYGSRPDNVDLGRYIF